MVSGQRAGPAISTASYAVSALEPHPHMPYTSSPPQQHQPRLSQRTYSGSSADASTAVAGGDIAYAVRGISITESPRTSSTQFPAAMPRPESVLPAQQQQPGTSNLQALRPLRQLAPAPRAPQQDMQSQPPHGVGRTQYEHPAQGANTLQEQSHQGSNWQQEQHMHPMNYSHQDATNYYNVPWQVGNMAHSANMSMSATGTRHYDPVATMALQTTGTGYYTSHDEYAAPPSHHDYRSH
ncbi:hypothetical protein SBRCBS47491_007251 [Sporothrix bragantina]|uniref:Uncharacterized protein n=1 Tax=Sporothrix bragantina TaxID=671064 RepID=A0ABP0CCS8_9PEZI